MKKQNEIEEWVRYAESDFAVAGLGRKSKKVLYATLCFHCQQTAEKALKAVLLYYVIKFPKTHDIEKLLDSFKENNIDIPNLVMKSKQLTDYAVVSRYPGDRDEITAKEYKSTLKIAESTLNWAKTVTTINKNKLF